MKAPTDWRDALASLGSSLPEGSDTSQHDEKPQQEVKEGNGSKAVTLFYERKGRGGKEATILADFRGVTDEEIKELASSLKRALGTGGSVRDGEILMQGDLRLKLRNLLAARGFKVKG